MSRVSAMKRMAIRCKLLGWIDNDLSSLHAYCQKVADAVGIAIPLNYYPIIGADAFRTSTGVHASALVKAARKGERWLIDSVYSGVPAAWFGREQMIEVGPMSGESNVVYWLKKRGFEPKKEDVAAILKKAKSTDHVLSEDEVLAILRSR
jgi:2-isopropylmalate synthase